MNPCCLQFVPSDDTTIDDVVNYLLHQHTDHGLVDVKVFPPSYRMTAGEYLASLPPDRGVPANLDF